MLLAGVCALLVSACEAERSVSAPPNRTFDELGVSPSSGGASDEEMTVSVRGDFSAMSHGTEVLHDQLLGFNAWMTSQKFEAVNAAFDNQGADDFVVPAGQQWVVTNVVAAGVITNVPAASANVEIYMNAGTLPANTPMCSAPAAPNTPGPPGNMSLPLNCALMPGHYWISVQAIQDFSPGNKQWFWGGISTQINHRAAWRNPGNGFGTGCTNWAIRAVCLSGFPRPDNSFRISGVRNAIVAIDIQPASLNCKARNGVVPVAVLGSTSFNVSDIDHTSVVFGPGAAAEAHSNTAGVTRHDEADINADGYADLMFHFRFDQTGIQCGDTSAWLTGQTSAGHGFLGDDTFTTKP